MYGYNGLILRVNLDTGSIVKEELREDVARKYIGGRGLAIGLLYDEIRARTNPLGPKNKLMITTGPFTGTFIVGNRFVVAAKSPLTGIWGYSSCGGYFGPHFKASGFDGVIVEGVSKEPVYLYIHDSDAELRDARSLYGLMVTQTARAIRKEIGKDEVDIACIGPAGEKLVRFASIIGDYKGASGRCGLGAVMGSKKLKAVAVSGERKVELASPKRVREISKQIASKIIKNPTVRFRKAHGRAGVILALSESGHLPTKNFQSGTFKGAEKITGETMTEKFLVRPETCWACPAATKRIIEIKSGPYAVKRGWGPEYETVAAFGSLCLNENLESIAKANEICNEYGIDTISTGNVIAFAMECFEKGIITEKDTGGMKLKWGNHAAIVELTKKISTREKFGNLLAEGVRKASETIGKGSDAFACHVKGLEVPMHTCRNEIDRLLGYVTSNRGACHLVDPARPIPEMNIKRGHVSDTVEGVPEEVKRRQDLGAVIDSLGICKSIFWYDPLSANDIVEGMRAVTGWDTLLEELLTGGAAIYNLERKFLTREGITRKDDWIPARFFEPFPEAPCQGKRVKEEELSKMLDEYYELRNWTPDGIPREK